MRNVLAASLVAGIALALAGCQTCPPRPVVDAGGPAASFSCCASADRAPVPATESPARFIVSAWGGDDSLVTLLDADLEAIAFPVASGGETSTWIARRDRWPNMRGTGLGPTPLLTRALSAVPGIVTFWGDTSLVALNLPTGQEDWEWVQQPNDEGNRPPVVDTVVVPDILEVDGGPSGPELHDLAFVARARIPYGSSPFGASGQAGGDIVVLDVEINLPAMIGSVDLEGIADSGLNVRPTMFAYIGGLLYAALDHSVVVGPDDSSIRRYGDGLLIAIDPVSRMVRHVVRFPGMTNCTQVVAELPRRTECGPGVEAFCDGTRAVPCDGTTPGTPVECFDADPELNRYCHEGNTECQEEPSHDEERLVVACSGTPESASDIPDDAGIVILTRDPERLAAPTIVNTITAETLSIPSPTHGLVSLSQPLIAFVATGDATAGISDRLYFVDVDRPRVDLVETTPAESQSTPVGLGNGAFDPVVDADGVTTFVVPAGRLGLFNWSIRLDDPADDADLDRSQLRFFEQSPALWDACGGLPAREVSLIP